MPSASLQRAHRGADAIPRHVLPEKHDVRLQQTPAVRAVRDVERRRVLVKDVGIAVGGDRRARVEKAGVFGFERLLDRFARMIGTAVEADHAADRPVQLDHVRAAGALVQSVHVLRHQPGGPADGFEPRQRAMRRIRPARARRRAKPSMLRAQ